MYNTHVQEERLCLSCKIFHGSPRFEILQMRKACGGGGFQVICPSQACSIIQHNIYKRNMYRSMLVLLRQQLLYARICYSNSFKFTNKRGPVNRALDIEIKSYYIGLPVVSRTMNTLQYIAQFIGVARKKTVPPRVRYLSFRSFQFFYDPSNPKH